MKFSFDYIVKMVFYHSFHVYFNFTSLYQTTVRLIITAFHRIKNIYNDLANLIYLTLSLIYFE